MGIIQAMSVVCLLMGTALAAPDSVVYGKAEYADAYAKMTSGAAYEGAVQLAEYFALSNNKIISGEPISVKFKLNKKHTNESVCGAQFIINKEDDLKVQLFDENKIIHGNYRKLVVWPCAQVAGEFIFNDNDDDCIDIPIHLFFSTHLPLGRYFVKVINMQKLVFRTDKKNKPRRVNIESDYLPFEVTKIDSDELCNIYKNMANCVDELQKIRFEKSKYGFRGDQDWSNYHPELRRLMWAWGKEAVPYQIASLRSGKRFKYTTSFTIHTYQNIFENPTEEEVKKMLEWAEDPEFISHQNNDMDPYYDMGLVWLLDEWKRQKKVVFLPQIEKALLSLKTPVDLLSLTLMNR